MGKVLGMVYRAISTQLAHKAGFTRSEGATGAVTVIQRFGSALNLNLHFNILFLDGAYGYRDHRPPRAPPGTLPLFAGKHSSAEALRLQESQ